MCPRADASRTGERAAALAAGDAGELAAAITSAGVGRRSAASGEPARVAKTSSPPAIPISSETQRRPLISGSSHSSK